MAGLPKDIQGLLVLFANISASSQFIIFYNCMLIFMLPQPIVRPQRESKPLVIPKDLKMRLPFKDMPKELQAPKQPKRVAVVLEPAEAKVRTVWHFKRSFICIGNVFIVTFIYYCLFLLILYSKRSVDEYSLFQGVDFFSSLDFVSKLPF